jgi:hypothetical protein
MEQIRLEQLSIYYWLVDLLPDFVNVEDEYPTDELKLPAVSIIAGGVRADPFELGADELDKNRWSIEVFAENSGQRADYCQKIFDNLTDAICVYDYDEGFPPPTPTQLGFLVVESRSWEPIRVYNELVKKNYWRGRVLFQTYFDSIT